jgi:hypothetical protein
MLDNNQEKHTNEPSFDQISDLLKDPKIASLFDELIEKKLSGKKFSQMLRSIQLKKAKLWLFIVSLFAILAMFFSNIWTVQALKNEINRPIPVIYFDRDGNEILIKDTTPEKCTKNIILKSFIKNWINDYDGMSQHKSMDMANAINRMTGDFRKPHLYDPNVKAIIATKINEAKAKFQGVYTVPEIIGMKASISAGVNRKTAAQSTIEDKYMCIVDIDDAVNIVGAIKFEWFHEKNDTAPFKTTYNMFIINVKYAGAIGTTEYSPTGFYVDYYGPVDAGDNIEKLNLLLDKADIKFDDKF